MFHYPHRCCQPGLGYNGVQKLVASTAQKLGAARHHGKYGSAGNGIAGNDENSEELVLCDKRVQFLAVWHRKLFHPITARFFRSEPILHARTAPAYSVCRSLGRRSVLYNSFASKRKSVRDLSEKLRHLERCLRDVWRNHGIAALDLSLRMHFHFWSLLVRRSSGNEPASGEEQLKCYSNLKLNIERINDHENKKSDLKKKLVKEVKEGLEENIVAKTKKTDAKDKPLSQELLQKMNAYWRAANYFRSDRFICLTIHLLKKPLKLEHIKPRLLGHFGTTPGLNFIYVHLNRIIKKYDLNMIYVIGPGHGAPGIVANTLSGRNIQRGLSEHYPG